ncbi:MAG: hypothetical protein ACLGJC_33940 [Alphaproteobacteria bacterium]
MEIPFSHNITYKIEDRPDAEEIAISILANKYMLEEAAFLLESALEGVKIEAVKVTVKSISQNSPLHEAFLVALFLVFQKDLEKAVPKVVLDLTGMKIPEEYTTLLTVGSCLIAFYGADWAYKKLTSGQKSPKIEKMLDALIDDVASSSGIPPEKVKSALEKRYSKSGKIQLVKKALNWFRPAKIGSGTMQVGDNVFIDHETIKEIPFSNMIDSDLPEDRSQPLEDVMVSIVAQDSRSGKRGWAARIDGINDKAIKMQLFPPITAEQLYLRSSVRCDGILVSKRQDDGTYKPTVFHMIRIHE